MEPPARKTNGLLRIAFAVVILGLSLYLYQQRKASEPRPSRAPFPASVDLATRFAWVPKYANAEVAGIRNRETREQIVYGYQFDTHDGMDQVLTFYERTLRSAGFKVDRKPGGEFGGSLHAEDSGGRRTLQVDAGKIDAPRAAVAGPGAGNSSAGNAGDPKDAAKSAAAPPASVTGVNVVAIEKLGG